MEKETKKYIIINSIFIIVCLIIVILNILWTKKIINSYLYLYSREFFEQKMKNGYYDLNIRMLNQSKRYVTNTIEAITNGFIYLTCFGYVLYFIKDIFKIFRRRK